MIEKIVGEPCIDCKTPYVMGKMGVYCKPCYIAFKEGQKQLPNQATPPSDMQIIKDWAVKTTQIMKNLQYKNETLEQTVLMLAKKMDEVQTKMEAQRTLLVELRGKPALDLHESFGEAFVEEKKAIAVKQASEMLGGSYDDIPVV